MMIDNENDDENNKSDDTYHLINTGRKICLHIRNVPKNASKLWTRLGDTPLIIWGLLEHEHKISVCHYLLKADQNYKYPIQGLDSYIFDLGYRRINARPIFSDHSRLNKHVVQKFMNQNEYCVATIYSPIQYPPIPVLMFENPSSIITKYYHEQEELIINNPDNNNINENIMNHPLHKIIGMKRHKDIKYNNKKKKQ